VEKREARVYQIEFTPTAQVHFYEVLDFFYNNYPLDRAEELANELMQMAMSLSHFPNRGTIEHWLENRTKDYRFLLFKRTTRAEVKIIYFVDDQLAKVYVTDFFGTEMDVDMLPKRNDK
jgi:hypothetical protein